MAWDNYKFQTFQLQPPNWVTPNYGPNYMNVTGGWVPLSESLNYGNYADQLQNPVTGMLGGYQLQNPVAGISATSAQMPDTGAVNTATNTQPSGTGAVNRANFQLGLNAPTLNMGINALGTLGNLYLGHEAMQQGWANYRLQRDYAAKNYANALRAYNTAMEDRIRARAAFYGESEDWIQEQLDRHLLPESKKKK